MSIISAYLLPNPPVLLPELGKGEEAKLEKTIAALERISDFIAGQKPETIVIATPHGDVFEGGFAISGEARLAGDFGKFGEPLLAFDMNCDLELAKLVQKNAEQQEFPAIISALETPLDHGCMAPLYFINKCYSDFNLLRVGVSGMSPIAHYSFGGIIAQAAAELGRRTVFIASGDLSHRVSSSSPLGISPDGAVFDQRVMQAFSQGDFESYLGYAPDFCESAHERVLRQLQIMAGVVGETPVTTEILSYESPFGVGHAVGVVSYK